MPVATSDRGLDCFGAHSTAETVFLTVPREGGCQQEEASLSFQTKRKSQATSRGCYSPVYELFTVNMIVRVSQKLAKKIKVSPAASLPAAKNPLADWSAHLFIAARTQYVIVTNTISLYSIVLYGRGISEEYVFSERLFNCLGEFMVEDGLEEIFVNYPTLASEQVQFSKALNRSVTG